MKVKETFAEVAAVIESLGFEIDRPPTIIVDYEDGFSIIVSWKIGKAGVCMAFTGDGQGCWSENDANKRYIDGIQVFDPHQELPTDLISAIKKYGVSNVYSITKKNKII